MGNDNFEEAARLYGDAVYRVACHALGDRAEAEDVTQTVLLRLYQHKGGFESEEHRKSWIFRVAVNESRKVLRSPWRRKMVPLEDWDGPAEEAFGGEVLEAVMALEAKYRLPIYLFYYEGFPVKEIAQILKTNTSTVQTRLQRGRENLKISLTNEQKEGTE
ncbi:MAG: sigma-70 family RNA polymerase sigma factor [Oscillospiraceae bacterium]|nr:sigma-70 family RNA polymerase sigma factor [Oscillospiraceae bacterium]